MNGVSGHARSFHSELICAERQAFASDKTVGRLPSDKPLLVFGQWLVRRQDIPDEGVVCPETVQSGCAVTASNL